MLITEIKTNIRPDASVPFFNQSGDSLHVSTLASIQSFKDAGKYVITSVISDDGLTQTNTNSFDSFETYSQVDTAFGIDLDFAYLTYIKNNNFVQHDWTSVAGRRAGYTQTGINQEFKVTTTYTFPSGSSDFEKLFADALTSYEQFDNQVDLVILESGIQVVHQYSNSADYTDFCFNDMFYVPQLHAAGVTRTIKYEPV
jgi:hypothetical protein